MKAIAEKAKKAGVVGAGGAGFPTYVKLDSSVKYMIANGAECEPLLHKDKELMLNYGDEIIKGLEIAVEATGASRAFFAAKKKYPDSYNLIRGKVRGTTIEMLTLGNFYPSGDEFEIVWEATRQLIPPGGIPLQVDTVVNNVETLYNLARAMDDKPVVDTFVTVSGAVRYPLTVWAPVGCSLEDILIVAGGATVDRPAALFNGAMMGSVERNLQECRITRTSTGMIVIPDDHVLIRKKTQTVDQFSRIGKSTCDQCNLCTQMCPRYLLGYAIEPHSVMRSLGFTGSHSPIYDPDGLLCCECNICSLYACPEDLNPMRVCVEAKKALGSAGRGKEYPRSPMRLHEMKEYRRVPLEKLTQRLGLRSFVNAAPFKDVTIRPRMVRIPLKQHIGEPAIPVVSVGESVKRCDVIAEPPVDKLGVPVHASISGKVTKIDSDAITIEQ
ncbi:4Fe-4S dicluster domain-containing protein [candidate division KSB1 bacterium]